MRPQEFHILPVLLDRFVVYITEVKDAAIFLIPSTLPHIINHFATEFYQMRVVITMFCFMQNKPGSFHGMTRIEGSPVDVIDDASVRGHRFHDALYIILYKKGFNLVDPCGYPLVATLITD